MTADCAVQQIYQQGRLQWPSIALSADAFDGYMARISDGKGASTQMRVHAADLYLCCACAQGDAGAARLFQREAQAVVHDAISRVCRDHDFISETLQEFWKKLLVGPQARVLHYRGRGPLQAWLRVAAARLAIDRHRTERTVLGRATDLGECLAEQELAPETTLTRARFQVPFRDALRLAVAALSNKERNLLRMHLLGRCTIDQIGRAYNVHRATAARWLEQAREHIVSYVRRDLQLKGNRLTESEFYSVARVVGTELEFEISQFAADAEEASISPTLPPSPN